MVNQLIYLESQITLTRSDANIPIDKTWSAMNELPIDLLDKIK